jgi:hypothetical protein
MSEDDPIATTDEKSKKRKPYPRRQAPIEEPRRIFTEKHHALFRPPQGQDWRAEKIERIYVLRRNREGEWEEATEWFPPDDLKDLKDIADRFGGGVYRLRAIRYDGTVYRQVETPRIPGPSKPLYYVEADEEPERPITPAASIVMPSGEDKTLAFMQIMMAESRASADRTMAMFQVMMQQQAAASQHSTEILVAALTGNRQDIPGMVTAIATAVKQPPAPIVQASDPMKAARDALEFAKTINPPKEEGIGEIVGAVAQGLGAVAMMQQASAAPSPSPAPLPPSPNGAPIIAG